MAHRVKDLAVIVDKYTDRDGFEKNVYRNVGVVMANDDGGQFLLLNKWFNPAGVPSKGEKILVSMFEPRDQQQSSGGGGSHSASADQGAADLDDDIPF